MNRMTRSLAALLLAAGVTACNRAPAATPRASGYVEATEVRVAAEVGGRIAELLVDEGKRVAAGDPIARIDGSDIEIAIRRASADRDQAAAQLRLVAGRRSR